MRLFAFDGVIAVLADGRQDFIGDFDLELDGGLIIRLHREAVNDIFGQKVIFADFLIKAELAQIPVDPFPTNDSIIVVYIVAIAE